MAILTVLLFIAGSVLWALAEKTEQREEAALATGAPATSPASAAAAAAPTAPRTAVAVLPFTNLTGDASKEYFGDGMADELINKLTKVKGLRVPARPFASPRS